MARGTETGRLSGLRSRVSCRAARPARPSARGQPAATPLARGEAAPGARVVAVTHGAVEASRFGFVGSEQPVALVQERVRAVGHRRVELVLLIAGDITGLGRVLDVRERVEVPVQVVPAADRRVIQRSARVLVAFDNGEDLVGAGVDRGGVRGDEPVIGVVELLEEDMLVLHLMGRSSGAARLDQRWAITVPLSPVTSREYRPGGTGTRSTRMPRGTS